MRAIGLSLLLLASATVGSPTAVERTARVTYGTADGFYVDAGTDLGLQEGDLAVVTRDGVELGRAEVVAVSSSSARLRLVGAASGIEPGDLVTFRLRAPAGETAAPPPEETPRRAEDTGEFVPLLERRQPPAEARTLRNVAHGRITLRQFFQIDNEDGQDYGRTVLGLAGSIDRLQASKWALRWNGNVSLRTGDAFSGSSLEDLRVDVYELALARPLEGGGLLQFGRFLPRGVRALGYLDGAQGEWSLSSGLRAGAAIGFQPELDDLAPSLDIPTAAAYVTAESGKRGDGYWTGTFGVLGAGFDGEVDRAALLLDQRVESGRASLSLSAEIDLDVGAAEVRTDSVRLTRLDVFGSVRVTDALTLRAGVDHDELLDNAAQRDRVASTDPALWDDGFWRYWIGGRVRIADDWDLDAELAAIEDPDDGTSPRGRVTVTWRNPFGWRGGSTSLYLYNLDSVFATDGYGGLLSAYLPAGSEGRWSLNPRLGFRLLEDTGDDFTVTDVALRVEYAAPTRWSVWAGAGWLTGDAVDAYQIELGVAYRW